LTTVCDLDTFSFVFGNDPILRKEESL